MARWRQAARLKGKARVGNLLSSSKRFEKEQVFKIVHFKMDVACVNWPVNK